MDQRKKQRDELYQRLLAGDRSAVKELAESLRRLVKTATYKKSDGGQLWKEHGKKDRKKNTLYVKSRNERDDLENQGIVAIVETAQQILEGKHPKGKRPKIENVTAYFMSVARSAMDRYTSENSYVKIPQSTRRVRKYEWQALLGDTSLPIADREDKIRRILRDGDGLPKCSQPAICPPTVIRDGVYDDGGFNEPFDSGFYHDDSFGITMNDIDEKCCDTDEERNVVRFKACGMTYQQIAEQIHKGKSTVKCILDRIEKKAVKCGLLPAQTGEKRRRKTAAPSAVLSVMFSTEPGPDPLSELFPEHFSKEAAQTMASAL
jgi:hypothetical protein